MSKRFFLISYVHQIFLNLNKIIAFSCVYIQYTSLSTSNTLILLNLTFVEKYFSFFEIALYPISLTFWSIFFDVPYFFSIGFYYMARQLENFDRVLLEFIADVFELEELERLALSNVRLTARQSIALSSLRKLHPDTADRVREEISIGEMTRPQIILQALAFSNILEMCHDDITADFDAS